MRYTLFSCATLVTVAVGCTQVVRVDTPSVNFERVRTRWATAGHADDGPLGVIVQVGSFVPGAGRVNEPAVVREVSARTMQVLKVARVDAVLLVDENDPRLDTVGGLLLVNYDESLRTEHRPLSLLEQTLAVDQCASCRMSGALFCPACGQLGGTDVQIVVEFTCVSLHRGESVSRSCGDGIEDVIAKAKPDLLAAP